jgi:hypothetical protein
MAKTNILKNYLSNLESIPQRSDEWYDLRKFTIGGSEIAALLGMNSYDNMSSLISGKLGISKFNGNIHTRWGTIFEPITNQWAVYVFNVKEMNEIGSIEGKIPRQRYSPDGVGIVKLKTARTADDKPADTADTTDYIILFEYKSPSCTIPNGKIAKNYRCQVQTGLLSIDITDYAIFINNCYRKCKLTELSKGITYDVKYHKSDLKKPKIHINKMKMFMCGVMCFYIDENIRDAILKNKETVGETMGETMGETVNRPDVSDNSSNPLNDYLNDQFMICDNIKKLNDLENLENLNRKLTLDELDMLAKAIDDPIDFGGFHNLEDLLKLWDDKIVKVKYTQTIWNNEEINKLDIVKKNNLQKQNTEINIDATAAEYISNTIYEIVNEQGVFIGVLPWKLLLTDNILEHKDPEWYNIIKPPLDKYFEQMDKIMSAECPRDEFIKSEIEIDDIDLSGYLP